VWLIAFILGGVIGHKLKGGEPACGGLATRAALVVEFRVVHSHDPIASVRPRARADVLAIIFVYGNLE